MSIEQTNIVDAIGIDKITNELVLTITDHLEWTNEKNNEHLLLLQEKINTYLGFVESGEIVKTYPNANGKRVLIDVVCKYPLNQQAKTFFSQVYSIIEPTGVKLRYRLFKDEL